MTSETNPPIPPERRWYKIAAAASYTGLTTSFLRTIPPDELPYHITGTRRDRRYRQSDLDAYLDRTRISA